MDQQPNDAPQADQDLSIGPGGGYYQDYIFEEDYPFVQNVTDATYKDILYVPIEYPSLMIQKEKFTEVARGLHFKPLSISWKITDVRSYMDVKLTSTSDTVMAMNDVGMMHFNPGSDMLVQDRLYPYARVEDHVIWEANKEKMRKKQLCTLLKTNLYMNNYVDFNKQTIVPENVSIRDPRFYEKNNAAEQEAFSGSWNNNVGLRIPIQFLHAPTVYTEEMTRFKFNTTTNLWTLMANKYDVTSLAVLPCDYRKGWISSPPDVDLALVTKTDQSKYCWGRPTVSAADITNKIYKETFTPDLGCYDAIDINYERAVVPYDAEEWDCSHFRHPKATVAIANNQLDHIWSNQKLNIWKPRFQPFTGNKTMKPLYLMFQPEYKGTEILPYWTRFKLKYTYKIRVFEIDRPQMEKPNFDGIPSADTSYTAITKNYAGDVLRQKVKVKNPYANEKSTEPAIVINSGWNKMYIPQFQRMYKDWKEKT